MIGTLHQPGTSVLSAVHIVLAAAVTVHALMNKRDVRASIGWIGIAWLSPILGSVLYMVFGINRVERRARRLRKWRRARPAATSRGPATDHGGDLAPLAYAARRITGRDAEDGNALIALCNGDEAYPRMIAAIGAARQSVALSSYIFEDDEAGCRFLEALTDAHRRGVEVRVIIDGIGGGYLGSAAYRRLRRAGVPAARFMHSFLPWRMPFVNLRSHKKILGIDGRIAFTGGLNISSDNLAQAAPSDRVRDTHFLFEGPIVTQVMESFAEDWWFVAGEELAGERWFPPLENAGDIVARTITSGPDQDLEKIEFVILEAIACARQSIRIMTPYFLPNDRLITALQVAATRGVAIDIVLPQRCDRRITDWAARAQLGPLIGAGCRIREYPPPFNHSKLMTVDGAWGLIGSANWDMRSFRLNFELNVEIYHAGVARRLDALMDTAAMPPMTAEAFNGRPFYVRLRDNGARLLTPYL